MNDVFRTILGVNLSQPALAGDVTDDRHQLQLRVGLAQLQVEEVEVALGLIEQNEPSRTAGGDLTGQLRADRARSSGQENHPILQVSAHRRQAEIDRGPPQQLLDADVAELIDGEAAVQQLVQRGQGLELKS